MTPLRFTPLRDEDAVFRTAPEESDFLPVGHLLPLSKWLEPTRADAEESARHGRAAGLSVWDCSRTTVQDVARLRGGPQTRPARAFAAGVGRVRAIGRERGRAIDVVTDPLDSTRGPGATGHCVIEGLKRPEGTPRPQHHDLLQALVEAFRPHP